MSEPEPLKEFKQGLAELRDGHPSSAVVHLRNAFEHDRANPFYLSYYGLAVARALENWPMAEGLCQAALRVSPDQPDFYLNLAEVFRRAQKLEDAMWVLNNGMHFTQRNARLARALRNLGIRRPPVISFLDRKHFLNRQLGKLRDRLGV